MVGLAGLEPATFRPPDGRATRLRHSPTIGLTYLFWAWGQGGIPKIPLRSVLWRGLVAQGLQSVAHPGHAGCCLGPEWTLDEGKSAQQAGRGRRIVGRILAGVDGFWRRCGLLCGGTVRRGCIRRGGSFLG